MTYWSMHIPKTGGTSFYDVLARNFDSVSPLLKRRDGRLGNGKYEWSQWRVCDVVHGHFKYDEIRSVMEEGDRLITWVRHPVDRVISNYHHFIRSITTDIVNPEMAEWNLLRKNDSLLEYAGLEDNQNRMTNWFGESGLEEYEFIGILENYQNDMDELAKLMNFSDSQAPLLNTAPQNNEVSSKNRRVIEDWNEDDMRLYKDIMEWRKQR